MKTFWKQVRYRLEYIGCRLLIGLIPLLSRRMCLWLANALGTLFYRLDGQSRRVSLENLRLTLGETLDPRRREEVARAAFKNFARAMLDLFWGKNLTPENYTRYIHEKGFEAARLAKAEHGGLIFLALHLGSHEWSSVIGGFNGFPATLVALDFKNQSLDAVFQGLRGHSGHRMVGQHQSVLRLLKVVKKGGNSGLLIDLALKLDQPGEVIDVFGMKMHVTCLHSLLHSRTGAPMVPITNILHPDGSCTVTAHEPLVFPPGASLREITQGCWNFFEPFIRERPELWMWNYKHWRYKPGDAPREYPFYAHPSKKFDRILAGRGADAVPPLV